MPDELNEIEIEGDAATLQSVRATPGLHVDDHGQKVLGPDRYRVTASATDAAIAALRARGLPVRVVQTAAEMKRHFEEMDRERNRDGGS